MLTYYSSFPEYRRDRDSILSEVHPWKSQVIHRPLSIYDLNRGIKSGIEANL